MLRQVVHSKGIAVRIESELIAIGWKTLARVQEPKGRLDLVSRREGSVQLVRFVDRSTHSDFTALVRMLDEGPFTRAILIYSEKEGSFLCDDVQTWWAGDIERLVTRLAAEAIA